MHLLCIAVNIISFVWLTDTVGPHSWKFILVAIAALPGPVDGVPEGEIVDEEGRQDPGSHRRLGGSCRALPSVVIYGFSQLMGKGKDDLLSCPHSDGPWNPDQRHQDKTPPQ